MMLKVLAWRMFSIRKSLLIGAQLLGLLLCAVTVAASTRVPARVNVLISFTGQPGAQEKALIHSAGGHIKYIYDLVPAMAVSVPETALHGLRHNPRVQAIEPDIQVQLVDSELDAAWGVQHIGAGAVHAQGNLGAGVKVGILDSGIDIDHPDLTYDPTCSASFVDGETLDDGHSHGSHVAGTLAALENDSGVVGVAPEATLCIYKVFSNAGASNYSDIVAAIDQAVADGVQVTNNSYGSTTDPGTIVKEAFDNANAAGILHIAAAGNYGNAEGTGENCIYPARWDSVMGTANTTQSDLRAGNSSTCPEVELAAPGNQIYSTLPGGGYGIKSGTSMATPHVAGSAALVLTAYPGWSNDQVRSQLQTTAVDLGDPGRDTWYGFGLVDAAEAALPSNQPPIADNQAISTHEDTPAAVTLTGSDPDGDALTYTVLTTPANGVLNGSPPDLTYTPDFNYYGADSFTFKANDGQADSNIATVTITLLPVNDPPTASFSFDCVTLTCEFDAAGSTDVDGSITSYAWDFGDGHTGSGHAPSHSYTAAGTYNVSLTVTDNSGAADTAVQAVLVSEPPPAMHVGDLDGSLASGNKNFWWAQVTIAVHDQTEGPVAGATVQGSWSGGAFGSGSCLTNSEGACTLLSPKISASAQTITFVVDGVTHAGLPYQSAANHDPDGDSDGTSIIVSQSGNQAPVAQFSTACSELTCTFDGSASSDPDGSIVSYAWIFGDGNTASGVTAGHTYAAAGTYPVSLTVTDNSGAEGAQTQEVTVGGSAGTIYVFDITMSGKAAGPNRSATAVVTIYDTGGNPAAGATVSGSWSGVYTAGVSSITDGAGQAIFSSGKARQANASFTFTVDDVEQAGFIYDPLLNNESAATIVVP